MTGITRVHGEPKQLAISIVLWTQIYNAFLSLSHSVSNLLICSVSNFNFSSAVCSESAKLFYYKIFPYIVYSYYILIPRITIFSITFIVRGRPEIRFSVSCWIPHIIVEPRLV